MYMNFLSTDTIGKPDWRDPPQSLDIFKFRIIIIAGCYLCNRSYSVAMQIYFADKRFVYK